jgi:excisionase family DNA binding protein
MGHHELLDTKQAAEYIGAQAHTLEIWRTTRRHKIPFIKVGRLVRYRRADLDAWLATRTIHAEVA